MAFDPRELIDLIPLALSALHPGSPEYAAFMQGYQQSQQRLQGQQRQQRLDTQDQEYRQAQIRNLDADNQRAEKQLALQRLTAFRGEGQHVLDALQQHPETALPAGTDPLKAQNELVVQRFQAAQDYGLIPPATDLRPDGTRKGNGFLGALQRPDGSVSSEISIGVNIDGREVDIPTLVPTLSPQERNWLLTHDISDPNAIPQPIVDKAVAHARKRLASGLSPFADGGQPAGMPLGPLPNMTQLVSEGKRRRARAVIADYDKSRGEQAGEADASESPNFGEFQGMTYRQIREIAQSLPPPKKAPNRNLQSKEMLRGGQRVIVNFEPDTGKYFDLAGQEVTDIAPIPPATAGPRPVSGAQKFTMTRALQNDWRKVSAPAFEINRQLSVMRNGMDALKRGDFASATEAVVVTFEKILDPNSVVREGEFWRAANGQSILRRVQTAMQRIRQGGYVTPQTMEEYMRLAEDVAAGMEASLAPTRQQIQQTAMEFDIDPNLILTDVMPSKSAKPANELPPDVVVKRRR